MTGRASIRLSVVRVLPKGQWQPARKDVWLTTMTLSLKSCLPWPLKTSEDCASDASRTGILCMRKRSLQLRRSSVYWDWGTMYTLTFTEELPGTTPIVGRTIYLRRPGDFSQVSRRGLSSVSTDTKNCAVVQAKVSVQPIDSARLNLERDRPPVCKDVPEAKGGFELDIRCKNVLQLPRLNGQEIYSLHGAKTQLSAPQSKPESHHNGIRVTKWNF